MSSRLCNIWKLFTILAIHYTFLQVKVKPRPCIFPLWQILPCSFCFVILHFFLRYCLSNFSRFVTLSILTFVIVVVYCAFSFRYSYVFLHVCQLEQSIKCLQILYSFYLNTNGPAFMIFERVNPYVISVDLILQSQFSSPMG